MTAAFVQKQALVKTRTGRLVLVPDDSDGGVGRELRNHAIAEATRLPAGGFWDLTPCTAFALASIVARCWSSPPGALGVISETAPFRAKRKWPAQAMLSVATTSSRFSSRDVGILGALLGN
jgi:hypothetical protein